MSTASTSKATGTGFGKAACALLLAAMSVASTACSAALGAGAETARVHIAGNAALELPDLDGRPVALASFGDKPVLVAFWRPDGPNAEREIVEMDRLQARLGAGAQVVVIAALDGSAWSEGDVRQIVKDRGLRLPVLLLRHAYEAPAWAEAAPRGAFVAVVDRRGSVRTLAREVFDWTSPEAVASITELARCGARVATR